MKDSDREGCSCFYVDVHEGVEAERYIEEHLEKVATDAEMWTVEYRCPAYGKRWLRDQPWGEMHGGGPYRLRTVDRVRRDLRNALATVPFAIPDDEDATEMSRLLMGKATDPRIWVPFLGGSTARCSNSPCAPIDLYPVARSDGVRQCERVASLESAVERGMLARLLAFGFTVAEASESHRGSSVRLANGASTVVVTADWLEGELEVTAGPTGEEGIPFRDLIPPGAAHGLHLRRLPRDVSTSVVEDQLAQVADLLLQHQPGLLTRT